jgi:hypothetical protein
MPASDEQAPAVDRPKHKLSQLTTYELRDYRKRLEQAIAFFDRKTPVPPARDDLQEALNAVIAEQDERAKMSRA